MPHQSETILFDAGQTLLEPTLPIPDAYLREAEAAGASPEPGAFHEHLAACWARFREAPPLDLSSTPGTEAEMWHQFTAMVADPFPDLSAIHEAWLARLVSWFDAPAAWQPMDGALELLSWLRQREARIGLVSNWHTALRDILHAHNLHRALDVVIISAEFGMKKPHPSIFKAALSELGRPPETAVHVGDSLRDDVLGARAAGLRAVLLADEPPPELPPDARCVASLRMLM